MRVLESCTRYALGCDDGERFQAELEFDAIMPPEPLTDVGSTSGSAHHFFSERHRLWRPNKVIRCNSVSVIAGDQDRGLVVDAFFFEFTQQHCNAF